MTTFGHGSAPGPSDLPKSGRQGRVWFVGRGEGGGRRNKRMGFQAVPVSHNNEQHVFPTQLLNLKLLKRISGRKGKRNVDVLGPYKMSNFSNKPSGQSLARWVATNSSDGISPCKTRKTKKCFETDALLEAVLRELVPCIEGGEGQGSTSAAHPLRGIGSGRELNTRANEQWVTLSLAIASQLKRRRAYGMASPRQSVSATKRA